MQAGHVTLESVLAGIRMVETGSYRGDYQKRSLIGGRTYYGAYQIPTDNWKAWSAYARIPNASIRSPQAQDAVAAAIMSSLHGRFNSWDLATMAWYAGGSEATKRLAAGFDGVDSIRNPAIQEYVRKVQESAAYAALHPDEAYTVRIPSYQLATVNQRGSWIFPVAGKNHFSNDFLVPRTNNRTGIHGATDIYADEGTPIVSPVAGKVLSTKVGRLGGNTVRILGNDGVTYYFAHMAAQAVVNVGDTIRPGQHLGYVGRTGNARHTSPHLHFSMHVGSKLVNPFSYLQSGTTTTYTGIPNVEVEAMTSAQQGGGTTGMMTSWLQTISDNVSAAAPPAEAEQEPEPEVEEKNRVGLGRAPEAI